MIDIADILGKDEFISRIRTGIRLVGGQEVRKSEDQEV
jgi:hypothetical protein